MWEVVNYSVKQSNYSMVQAKSAIQEYVRNEDAASIIAHHCRESNLFEKFKSYFHNSMPMDLFDNIWQEYLFLKFVFLPEYGNYKNPVVAVSDNHAW